MTTTRKRGFPESLTDSSDMKQEEGRLILDQLTYHKSAINVTELLKVITNLSLVLGLIIVAIILALKVRGG